MKATPRLVLAATVAVLFLFQVREAEAYVTNEWALYANGAPGIPVTFTTNAMMNIQQGFCFFTHIQGQFEGGGEGGQLWVGSDGNWRMKVWAQQPGIGFRARCVTWDSFPNSANHTYTVAPRWDYSYGSFNTPVWGIDSICLLDLLSGQYSETYQSAGTTTSSQSFSGGPVSARWLNQGNGNFNGTLVESGTFCANFGHAAHLVMAPPGYGANYDFLVTGGDFDDVAMLGVGAGICWLNGIQGRFDGAGEQATVYVGGDHNWHLQQLSQQSYTASMAACAYFH